MVSEEIRTERERILMDCLNIINRYLGTETAPACSRELTRAIEGEQEVRDYTQVKAVTYAKAVEALRRSCEELGDGLTLAQPTFTTEDGSQVPRPLSFKEVLEAKVDDFETLLDINGKPKDMKDRLRLWNVYNDSCTGNAHKADSDMIKIIPVCQELVLIDPAFSGTFLPVSFASLKGTTLNRTKATYNQPLTKQAYLNHPAWNAACETDKVLLKTHWRIVFEQTENEKMMGWYLRNRTTEDELRAVYVGDLGRDAFADGSCGLDVDTRLVQVALKSAEGDAHEK